MVLSALGTATSLTGPAFPSLALGSLGFELWVAALAWHWLREERTADRDLAASPVTA